MKTLLKCFCIHFSVLLFQTSLIAQVLEEIPNPNQYSLDQFQGEINEGLFFHYVYVDSSQQAPFFEYDGTDLIPIPIPEENGFSIYTNTYKNKHYFSSFPPAPLFYPDFFEYDDVTAVDIIPSGLEFVSYDATYKELMYLTLINPLTGNSFIYTYDGNTFTGINPPDGLTLINFVPYANYKDLLYFTFLDTDLNYLMYSYDGIEFKELNVPSGLGSAAYFGENNGIAYFTFQQDTSIFLTTLFSYDGNTFTEIPIPSYFLNWIYTSGKDEKAVYHVYRDDNSVFHILAVEGSESYVISPPNGVVGGVGGVGYPRYQTSKNGRSYFSVGSVFFYLDGNTSTEVIAPEGFQFASTIGEINNETYLAYIGLNGKQQLAKINSTGTAVELIDSPIGQTSVGKNITIEDDKIFIGFTDDNFIQTLFSFDGNTFTEIPNPTDKELWDLQVKENGILYLRYNNISDELGTLYKLDVSTISTSANNILTFEGKINLTPNPTSSDFNLTINSEKEFNQIELQLYNSTGQFIQTNLQQVTGQNFQQRINIQDLPIGVYFLYGKTDVGNFQRKVVKM